MLKKLCFMSHDSAIPPEAKELWKGCGICRKGHFLCKGGIMNLFFLDVPELKKPNGGYRVSYKWLKQNVTFEEVRPGLWVGLEDDGRDD